MAKRPTDGLELIGQEESAFTFPLPTQVEGLNARGKDFTEHTVLLYISHQGSSFYLRNAVEIGARLKLVIDLPPKLSDNEALKLVVKGRVVRIESLRDGSPEQKITLHFDSKYIIKPDG